MGSTETGEQSTNKFSDKKNMVSYYADGDHTVSSVSNERFKTVEALRVITFTSTTSFEPLSFVFFRQKRFELWSKNGVRGKEAGEGWCW